jgi:hypothetical protein
MNVEHAPTEVTESRERHNTARVPGLTPLLARVVWGVLVVLTLAIFGASLPVYITLLHIPCAPAACIYGFRLTPAQAGVLKGIGLSPDAYAAFYVAFTLAILLVCLVTSTLIVWRRSDDRMALLVALLLVTNGAITVTTAVAAGSSLWQVPNECLTVLYLALFLLVFLLFPSGQFVPRWTRWIFVVLLVGQVLLTFFPHASFTRSAPVIPLVWLVYLGELAIAAFVQLYRYHRVSGPRERQQTKWVVFGFAFSTTVGILVTVPPLIFPVLASPGSLYPLVYNQVGFLLTLSLPFSFGFAMLHSRLWDIDIIINRTLVYGALTIILTTVYVGLVIGLQTFLRGIISQDNSIAIVISTLAIAALFQPLRTRIQRLIDRRFYRSKYDAARTLAAFSATLRNEVDLDTLSRDLVAVVQETMQPAHISLWLRPLGHDDERDNLLNNGK